MKKSAYLKLFTFHTKEAPNQELAIYGEIGPEIEDSNSFGLFMGHIMDMKLAMQQVGYRGCFFHWKIWIGKW